MGRQVSFICCGSNDEIVLLKKTRNSAQQQFHVSFEFEACDTPQQNHLAELAFTTFCN